MSITGNILITGGSGTLGHAIVRRALVDGWDCDITIYSRSELSQARMRQKYPNLRYLLGDVRDFERLQAACAGQDVVIHAAAVKRIPEAEAQPEECYKTNVWGSQNVARACISMGVSRCVGVSTDKACRAITAYGASKLAMEKLFQAQRRGPTAFTLVRYGNVVASNGSVIPLWRELHEQGKSIKITDSRCTRFWMSESDAVELIEMAVDNPHGTILVPKMGKLPIVQMAQIVVPGAHMVEVGFRSVEKLHEDLVHTDEEAVEMRNHFLIGKGSTGHVYTSEMARDLTAQEFLSMLKEAEENER